MGLQTSLTYTPLSPLFLYSLSYWRHLPSTVYCAALADDGDFFDNLQPSSALPTPEKPRSEQAEPPSPAMRGPHLEESAGESEATIERALYIGNYSHAVDACIKVLSHMLCCCASSILPQCPHLLYMLPTCGACCYDCLFQVCKQQKILLCCYEPCVRYAARHLLALLMPLLRHAAMQPPARLKPSTKFCRQATSCAIDQFKAVLGMQPSNP